MLPYATAFNSFQPKATHHIDFFRNHFSSIAERAQFLLIHRSEDEILSAAVIIDVWTNLKIAKFLIDDLETVFGTLEAASEAMKNDTSFEKDIHISPTDNLLFCLDRIEIDEEKDFPNATKSEYVAVLALCLIGLACEEQKLLSHSRLAKESPDNTYCNRIGMFAIDAMEAIVTAERLANDHKAIEAATQKRISLQNTRAIRIRHEPVQKLKNEFFHYYRANMNTGKFHSQVQAAQQFYESLPLEKKRLLSPTNAVRTLTDALRIFLRDANLSPI